MLLIILQKYETENNETTVYEITRENTTKIAMTSERAPLSLTTSEQTTNHVTAMEKLTSQNLTSNGLNMTSQRATISDTTSERKTTHGTTIEKLTSQKPTSNGLNMTSQRATISGTTSERKTTHGTTIEKLTSQKPTSNGLNMTSQRATISGTTSERKTTHGTTIEKLTSQKPTSNGLHDCSDVSVGNSSGVYTIYVDNQPLDVYCEMTGSGQWTVFQRRMDGLTDFYRTWQEYKQGFGNVNSEYWLGNDKLHKILSTGNYTLRVDLEDWRGRMLYAEYDTFVVGNESTNYVLTIANYNGNAGDSLTTAQDLLYQPNGYGFSTWDRDNDGSPHINCAEVKHAGWWLNYCTKGNLNGKYYNHGGMIESDGIYWEAWKKYSLKSVSMKIKQV